MGISVPGHKNNWDKGDASIFAGLKHDRKRSPILLPISSLPGTMRRGIPDGAGRVEDSRPILSWANHLGSESITYIPGLRKYILMTARLQGKRRKPGL